MGRGKSFDAFWKHHNVPDFGTFLDIDYFSYQAGIMELKLLICANNLFLFFFHQYYLNCTEM